MPAKSTKPQIDFSSLPSLTEFAESSGFGPTSFRGYIVDAGYQPYRITPKEITDSTDLRYKLQLWVRFRVLEVLESESGWDPSDHDGYYEHYWSLGGKSLLYFYPTNDMKSPAGLSGGFEEQALLAAGRTEGGKAITWTPDEGHDISEIRGRWFAWIPGTPENKRKIEPKSSYAIFVKESTPAVEATDPSLVLTFANKKGEDEKTLNIYAQDDEGLPLGAHFFVGLEGVWDTKKIALPELKNEKGEPSTQRVLFISNFDGRREMDGEETETESSTAVDRVIEKKKEKTEATKKTASKPAEDVDTSSSSDSDDDSLPSRITRAILSSLPEKGKMVKGILTQKVLKESKLFTAKEMPEALETLTRVLSEAPTAETAEYVDPAPLFTFDPKTQEIARWTAQ